MLYELWLKQSKPELFLLVIAQSLAAFHQWSVLLCLFLWIKWFSLSLEMFNYFKWNWKRMERYSISTSIQFDYLSLLEGKIVLICYCSDVCWLCNHLNCREKTGGDAPCLRKWYIMLEGMHTISCILHIASVWSSNNWKLVCPQRDYIINNLYVLHNCTY